MKINDVKVFVREGRIYNVATQDRADELFNLHKDIYGDIEMKSINEIFPASCESSSEKLDYFLSRVIIKNEIVGIRGDDYIVEVEGDWKHGHLALDHMLETAFGLKKIGSWITEDTGGDWYTGCRRYR